MLDFEKKPSDWLRPFNIISLMLAILGVGSGYYFYRASQPTFKIGYIWQNEVIARLNRDDLSILIGSEKLDLKLLNSTKIGFWNAGTAPIEISSVRRPFTIEFKPEDKVVQVSLISASHNISGIGLREIGNRIEVSWKYFDPNFSFVIEVLHATEDPPQISLRYVGDKEITKQVSRNTREGYKLIAISLIAAVMTLVLFASLAVGALIRKSLSEEILFGRLKIPPGFVIALTRILFILLAGAVLVFFVENEFDSFLRSVFDISVPPEMYAHFSIDKHIDLSHPE
jgi:hypothetical protein